MHTLPSLLPVLFAGALAAQQATVQVFSWPCGTVEGRATMRISDVPQIGSSFEIGYDGPNHFVDNAQTLSRPTLVIGFSVAGPVTIPRTLFSHQPSGCELWPAADWIEPMPFPDPLTHPYATQFPATHSIVIPADATLIGLPFFAQWLAVNTQCGFAGCDPVPRWIGTSATALCTIGL